MKKIVEKKDYVRVLSCLDRLSVIVALNSGLKTDDIKEFEMYNTGMIRVITEGHLLNLRVNLKLIEWD